MEASGAIRGDAMQPKVAQSIAMDVRNNEQWFSNPGEPHGRLWAPKMVKKGDFLGTFNGNTRNFNGGALKLIYIFLEEEALGAAS